MVRRCTFLQGLFIYRPGYLTIMAAKRSESWSPRRLLSLAVNHASWYSHPWAVLSLNLNQSHDWKKTQKVTLCDFQGGIGHFEETLPFTPGSLEVLLLRTQQPCCEEPKAHEVATCRHSGPQPASSTSHVRGPAWSPSPAGPPDDSPCPCFHATTAACRTPRGNCPEEPSQPTEPSKTVKCHFHLRMS